MQVILLERVENLGQMGDVVNVKTGYARNFLLPQKKALRATDSNKARFEAERAQLEAENLKRRDEAEAVAKKLDGLSIPMVRQAGEAGQLYGSVTARDVADGVTDAGFTIQRSQVVLDRPIKTIGLHPIRVNLHPEVAITITANIARTEEEVELQTKTGRPAIAVGEEPSAAEAAPAIAEGEAEAEEAVPAAEEFFEEGATPDEIVEEEAAAEGTTGDEAAEGDEETPAGV